MQSVMGRLSHVCNSHNAGCTEIPIICADMSACMQAVHSNAASKGATKETPHLANLPTKQTTSVINSLEPGHEKKKANEE